MTTAATRDGSLIDEIVREGARRMLAAALEAEVNSYIAELADETRRARAAPGGPQRPPPAPDGDHRGRAGRGQGAAGERQARRRGDRRAQAVLLGDPAAVVPQVPEGQRGAAAALPARPVVGGLRARAGAVPRLGGRAVAGDGDPADRRSGRPTTPPSRAGTCRDRDYVYVWADGVHLQGPPRSRPSRASWSSWACARTAPRN